MRKTKVFFVSVLMCFAFAGCASQSVRYSQQNKPLAEQGKIKWSDYYKGLYEASVTSSGMGQGQFLSRINTMILAAQSYESGKISKDQFEYFRREAQAGQAAADEAASARLGAALAAAGQSISSSAQQPAYKIVQPMPPTTTNATCNSFGGQLNCTSRTQ